LDSLSLAGNELEDLTPLADLSVAELDLSDNRIVDLTPVLRPRLRNLTCFGNPVARWSTGYRNSSSDAC
jgi:Leucine-rich repeat (LRR) protein